MLVGGANGGEIVEEGALLLLAEGRHHACTTARASPRAKRCFFGVCYWNPFTGDHERAEPQGEVYIRWQTPDDTHATLVKVGWDPDEGGSEDLVWQALELLAGRALR